MSYTFFYASSLVGPAFDFREYIDFVNVSGEFASIPSSFFAALYQLTAGFICLVLTVVLAAPCSPKLAATQDFVNLPWWRRVLFMHAASFVTRVRYYTAWSFATANCIKSGFSYNGKDKNGKDQWDRVVSVRIVHHETSDNLKDRLEDWNTSIQVWLKRYVFYRVCREDEVRLKPKKAAFASNVTFMVSAFWHGFYPAYYFTFFHLFIVQQVSKSVYAWKDKFRFIPGPLQILFRWYLTALMIDSLGVVFQLLEYEKSLIFLKSVYFISSLIGGTAYIVFSVIGNPRKKTDKRPTGADGTFKSVDQSDAKKIN